MRRRRTAVLKVRPQTGAWHHPQGSQELEDATPPFLRPDGVSYIGHGNAIGRNRERCQDSDS